MDTLENVVANNVTSIVYLACIPKNVRSAYLVTMVKNVTTFVQFIVTIDNVPSTMAYVRVVYQVSTDLLVSSHA